MFVLTRDATYVDYHARDETLLFRPPSQFLGRRIPDVMPPPLAEMMSQALERAFLGEEPVVIEYEILMREARAFEARLVAAEPDRVLCIVRDVTESKRARERNRDLAGRLIDSQELERGRIARDLHDGVCQDLAAVSVDVSYLRQRGGDIQSQEAQEALLSLQRRTEDLSEGIRLMSHALHPSVLQHIGLVAALQAHCAEVERQHQLQVTFLADGDVEPTNRHVALPLFRIAQEALQNTVRHAGAARAAVALTRGDTDLTLTVTDDGVGFNPTAARHSGKLGLVSIEERARLIKGRAAIESQSGHGTTISVQIPLGVVDETETSADNLTGDVEPAVEMAVDPKLHHQT
jgi:signal transduction histidine kinase